MAEPFLSEIRMMSFNFPPKGWAFCDGQILPINQNQALFSLLGTTFGGNGQTSFALPDLRARVPIHVGGGHTLGERAGSQSHTLSSAELPEHSHQLVAKNNQADQSDPQNRYFANSAAMPYGSSGSTKPLALGTITNSGGSQPHTNMQPFLTINFCIALQGIFPSPN